MKEIDAEIEKLRAFKFEPSDISVPDNANHALILSFLTLMSQHVNANHAHRFFIPLFQPVLPCAAAP